MVIRAGQAGELAEPGIPGGAPAHGTGASARGDGVAGR
jgi:hypothetical protein